MKPVREKWRSTHDNFFVKGRRYQEVWKQLPQTSLTITKQYLQKNWIPFIRREPRYQDYPTRTPPANSVQMDKATQIEEGYQQENRYGSSRPGHADEKLNSLRPRRCLLQKCWKYGIIEWIPLKSRSGNPKTASAQKRANPQGVQIVHWW